jgi:hypothetical protein
MNANAEAQLGQAPGSQGDIAKRQFGAHRLCGEYGIALLPRIGLRCSKQREQPIAHELGDMPVMSVDGLAHVAEVVVQDPHRDRQGRAGRTT